MSLVGAARGWRHVLPGGGQCRGRDRPATARLCRRFVTFLSLTVLAQGPGVGSDAARGLPGTRSVTQAVCSGPILRGQRLACVPGGVCPGLVSAVLGPACPGSHRPLPAAGGCALALGTGRRAAGPARSSLPLASERPAVSSRLPGQSAGQQGGPGRHWGPPTVLGPERDQAEGTPTPGCGGLSPDPHPHSVTRALL